MARVDPTLKRSELVRWMDRWMVRKIPSTAPRRECRSPSFESFRASSVYQARIVSCTADWENQGAYAYRFPIWNGGSPSDQSGFNTKSWSSMTWMILGYHHFRNPPNIFTQDWACQWDLMGSNGIYPNRCELANKSWWNWWSTRIWVPFFWTKPWLNSCLARSLESSNTFPAFGA